MEAISSTPHSPEAIPQPSLSTMPTEILIKIAKWVARDTLVSFGNPETRPELEYIANNGEPRHYWSWSRYITESRYCLRNVVSQTDKADTHDYKSIRSLSHTCVRLFRACQVVLYHTAVIRGDNHRLQSFLKVMTSEESAHLQQYVTCLAVTYDFTVSRSIWILPARSQLASYINVIENTLASGTVRLPHLRSLDLNDRARGKIGPDCWYSLLPTLPMLEHLTLRDFSGIDRDLPFPELPQLKAVHFYHRRERYRGDTRWGDPDWWESRVPCCITKSLLEKLPSLRTLAHHGDCGRCLPDVFEPVQDVLQALAWVDGEPYYYDHKTPDINCLRRLRHIKIGFYESYFWDGTRPRSLCDGKALPRMESLETVEVIARRRQPSGEGIIIPFRRMVETFSSSKNAGGFKSLRVVDLRSFGLWNFSTAKWKAMKDEFLDTEIREYRELGINLLLPEAAGCS